MDRLDGIITPDTYKKLADKFEEQKMSKSTEIKKLKQNLEDYNRYNSIEKLLEVKTVV